MANINKGIIPGSAFSRMAPEPLDLKTTAATLEERNSYVPYLYKGAIVYVEEDNTFWTFTGTQPSGEDYSACFSRLVPTEIAEGDFATLDGDNAFTGTNSFTTTPTIDGETIATTADVESAVQSGVTDQIGQTIQAHSDKLNDVAALNSGLLAGTADAIVGRTLTSSTLTVTNGDGVAGDPTIEIPDVGTAGSYFKVTTDAKGRVTAGENPTTLAGFGITDAVNKAGDTVNGKLTYGAGVDLGSLSDLDLVPKVYADSVALGYTYHVSCATGASSNVEGTYADGSSQAGFPGVGATFTLTANTGNTTQIGGLTLRQGMRVMLMGQTDAKQNGCYVVTTFPAEATGQVVLTRADDFDGHPEITYKGATFLITHGQLTGTSWRLSNTGTITFGTDDINFVQISTPVEYTAGDGIDITANVVSVKEGTTVAVIGGNLEVTSGTGNTGKVLTAAGDGAVATWQTLDLSTLTGVLSVAKGGTGASTLPQNQLLVGNGTNAVQAVANADGVLIGSASAAPSFGKVNLASLVDGVLPLANGGTGVANSDPAAITIGNVTLNAASASSVTLPTTGTLATLAGAETLSNKTIQAVTVAVSDTTDATTAATGALTVAGGMGVAKSLHVGTSIVGNGTETAAIEGFIIDGGEY